MTSIAIVLAIMIIVLITSKTDLTGELHVELCKVLCWFCVFTVLVLLAMGNFQ